jgi:hypothetical protein
MPESEIKFLQAWFGERLDRIETKLDRYGDRQNAIEQDLAELKARMIDRKQIDDIAKKVEVHDAWINVIRWVVITVLAVIVPAVLVGLWILITHGASLTQLLDVATPFIVTATPMP